MERFLFQGDSCFPLSPYKKEQSQNGKKIISHNDLMKVILRNIGPQDEKDLSYITNENVRTYIADLENSVFNSTSPEPSKLNELIEYIGEDFSEVTCLLGSFLEFNPFFRMTAYEAIQSTIFDSMRKPDIEKGLLWMKEHQKELLIELEVDTYDAFDYTSKIIGKHSQQELRGMLRKEIMELHE